MRLASSQVSVFCHGPSIQEKARHDTLVFSAGQNKMSSAKLNGSIKSLSQLIVTSFSGLYSVG